MGTSSMVKALSVEGCAAFPVGEADKVMTVSGGGFFTTNAPVSFGSGGIGILRGRITARGGPLGAAFCGGGPILGAYGAGRIPVGFPAEELAAPELDAFSVEECKARVGLCCCLPLG